MRTEAEVEGGIILIALPHPAALNLAGESFVAKLDVDPGADRGSVDGHAVAFQADLQPVVVVPLVHEEPAIRHQVQVTVTVDIAPGGLVR